jgi:hypothetical protein
MKIIDIGLSAAESFMPIPLAYCRKTLHEFKNGGFKNDWIQARNVWQKWSVRCDIEAKLTIEEFALLQRVYHNDILIVEREIVKSRPREALFVDFLGSLQLDRSGCIRYKARNKELTSFDLRTNRFSESSIGQNLYTIANSPS